MEAFAPFVVGLEVEAVLRDTRAFSRSLTERASCAGWGRRRASCTWRSQRSSTPCGTCGRSARASRCGSSSPTCAGGGRRARRLHLPHRRAHARRGARPARGAAFRAGRAGADPARARPPGLHDLAGLARLRRRQAAPADRRGAGRRVHADQAQGGRRPGRRRPALRHRARRHGPRPAPVHRREPGVGRAGGDRVGPRAGRVRPDLDRGAHEPGRRARPRRHRPRVAPVGVATGEHAQNRVIFKQLLQQDAIGFCQIDACRLAGVNEVVAVLLLAAKFGVPVCPHAGGVGLCELVPHLAAFDYVALGGELDDRVVEYVDHLHEHFVDPCVVERARYRAPSRPGYSAEMHREVDRPAPVPRRPGVGRGGQRSAAVTVWPSGHPARGGRRRGRGGGTWSGPGGGRRPVPPRPSPAAG